MRRPLAFLITGGFALAVGACVLIALAPPGEWRGYAMAAVVLGYALWSRSPVVGLATGVMAWFFTTGFLINTAGQLTFASSDLGRLLLLLAAGFGGGLFPVLRVLRAMASVYRSTPVRKEMRAG